MKCILVALDTQYVHTNLAVRYLASCCDPASAPVLCEYNINQQSHLILHDLLSQSPDLIGFSCYIWNIEPIFRLCDDLRKADPHIKLLLGGPEVSFTAAEIMREHSFVDYILCGEGEETFPLLMDTLANGGDTKKIPGLLYRENGTICGDSSYQIVKDLNRIPFAYIGTDLFSLKDRIVYYESSRGCPYACAYCLSGSMGGGLRELPVERVKKDLSCFINNGVPLVKFIDRTFNANKERAKEILRFILAESGDTRFHFEIGADLLDDALLELFCNAPKGKIQLEAGVQSCNPVTLNAVVRRTDMEKLKKNVTALIRSQKVHMHLDLIAGLPYEDFCSFSKSFDEVYLLQPHQLQLGFLKLLKGSSLYYNAAKYGIAVRSYPPYEVIATDNMSATELLALKGVEEVLERYYNSGRTARSIKFLLDRHFASPFTFYYQFSLFCDEKGYLSRPLSVANQFCALYAFVQPLLLKEEAAVFLTLLKLDYLSCGAKGTPPLIFESIKIPSVKDAVQQANLEERISKQDCARAKFDLLPYHPFTLEKKVTLIRIEPDKRDALSGQCKITVI